MKKTEKFADGLVWNYVSTLFLAAGGFLFSIIIAVFYDEEVLGVFNQIFAYYILLSQLAVLASTLRLHAIQRWQQKIWLMGVVCFCRHYARLRLLLHSHCL